MLRIQHKVLIAGMIILLLVGSMIFTTQAAAAAAASGNLSRGDRGSAVTRVQQLLNNQGYWCGSADGIFGASTEKAVLRFQSDNKIPATGIVGPITQNALGFNSSSVSRGGYPGSETMTMVATGYDSSYECNYPFYGQPSFMGLPLARGIIATDPDVIPMGTRLYVEGYGEAIAADQGNAIKGNRIDLFFDSHSEAMNWGQRTVKVTIL